MSTFAAHLLAFAGAAFLLAIAPGPATAVLLRQTIRHGRARGFATVAGIESGVFFWAVMAASWLGSNRDTNSDFPSADHVSASP